MNIGNTPFVSISINGDSNVYTKLESYNFSGSIKARMAYNMMVDAMSKGLLKQGGTIIEATTGNTGIAFSALGAYFGFKMIAVMPENQSVERIKLMKLYGANVVLTSAKEGPMGAIKKEII